MAKKTASYPSPIPSSCPLLTLLHQHPPQPIPLHKIPPNNIHQPQIPPQLPQQPTRRRPPLINSLPLPPRPPRFLAPTPKAHRLDNRRRDDLLPRESAPRHRVNPLLVARVEVARCIPREIGNLLVGIEPRFENRPVRGWDEEFDEGLLEDEAVAGTPAEDGVGRADTVDGGLGGDGPPAFVV